MNLRPSHNTRISENSLGRTVTMGRRSEWRHPWFTSALWLPKKKAWVAFVLAGFCNGFAPVVRTTAGELREAQGAFFGQLVDANSGADEIAQLALLAIGGGADEGLPDNAMLDVPLYLRPPVPMNKWRKIGFDGEIAPPLFFQQRGVAKPITLAQIEKGEVEPPKGSRLLRACDIWLQQPRAALTSQITTNPLGFLTGTSNVTQTLATREPSPNDRLKIQTGTFEPQQANRLNFRGASNLLASDYEEAAWDQILISTVWLLSPPDTAPGTEPDATWQAFSSHKLFWNLLWSQPKLAPFFNTDIFRPLAGMVGVIAGGVGLGAVNFFAATLNDATQGAFNILQAQSLAGSFWTPTGSGTTSAWPLVKPGTVPSSLDKAANTAARAKARRAELIAQLDPNFPYEGKKFNRALL